MRGQTGWISAVAALWFGCGATDPNAPTLSDASQEVQFESVDRLGPHLYLASIRHRAARADGAVDRTDEAVEIRWQDWDTFAFRRVVDAQLQSAVVTVEGRPWSLRSKGRWERREDAEPYRLDLRQSWNAWEQALEPFDDRIVLEEEGSELFEGRAVRRYTVSLAPESDDDAVLARGKGKRRRQTRHQKASSVQLLSLTGRVWVDEGTAVRLQADVTGELEHRGRRRTVELQLTRSGIGQSQDIEPPVGAGQRLRPASLPDATSDDPPAEAPAPVEEPTPTEHPSDPSPEASFGTPDPSESAPTIP